MLRSPSSAPLGLVTLFVLFQGTASLAQPSAPIQIPWPMEVTRSAFSTDSADAYLCVFELLEREEEAREDPQATRTYLDVLATHLSFVGEHRRALEAGDEAFGKTLESMATKGPDAVSPAGGSPAPAVEAIIEASRGRAVVMLNEEHRSSEQRAFVHQLLIPLWDEGFRYLALETLSEDFATLQSRGYPVMSSGTYTRDPVFGDLVRRALEIGYRVVGYEADPSELRPRLDDTSPLDAMNRRERGQARNLFERTLQRDPEARVLVLAGRDHISEGGGDGWIPMGAAFREISEVDPLTINQMILTEHTDPRFEHWAYQEVEESGWLRGEPILVVGENGGFWSHAPGALDASLVHPRARWLEGRPHWMTMGGLRRAVRIEVPRVTGPLLLQATVAGEESAAVPLDQVLVWPGEPVPALMLRPGEYVVRALDPRGEELVHREIEVPGDVAEAEPDEAGAAILVRTLLDRSWPAENEALLERCTRHTRYSYGEGNVLGSLVDRFRPGRKPEELRRRARNDAVVAGGLILVEDTWIHFESGLSYEVATYRCPEGTEFLPGLSDPAPPGGAGGPPGD